MKLFVACFIAVTFSFASSLPATPIALPSAKTNYSKVPDAQIPSTVVINGHVAIYVYNHTQTCFNQDNSTVSHPPPKLPDGYETVSEGGGYISGIKLYPTALIFNEARKVCALEGAFLAYPTTKEENDLYIKKMDDNKIIDIWTGIHDLYTQFDWSTILGEVASDVAYFKWRPGQPDNAGDNERCTHVRKEGLNDISCANLHAFICKIKLPLSL